MWIMGKIDESYLENQVKKERITEDEKSMIVATPKIEG
jgi:hypothetical protein